MMLRLFSPLLFCFSLSCFVDRYFYARERGEHIFFVMLLLLAFSFALCLPLFFFVSAALLLPLHVEEKVIEKAKRSARVLPCYAMLHGAREADTRRVREAQLATRLHKRSN